jgi:hypothetical protein
MLALIKFTNPEISIDVYEEGIGTYRTDIYSGIKKQLFSLVGVGVFFGACRFVSSVYVFQPQEYLDRIPSNGFKVLKIHMGLAQFIVEYLDVLKRVFENKEIASISPQTSICSIFLSSWHIDAEFLEYFRGLKGDLFMKLHPHIRDNKYIEGVNSINSSIPAELVLTDLMKIYDSVVVFDHNSSIRRYISGKNLVYKMALTPKNISDAINC